MSETKAPETNLEAHLAEVKKWHRDVTTMTVRAICTLAGAIERAYTIGGDILIDVGPRGAFAAYTPQTVLGVATEDESASPAQPELVVPCAAHPAPPEGTQGNGGEP